MAFSGSDPLTAESLVMLRGGLTVRVEAVRLLLDLEARGVKLERDADDILIRSGSPVTEDDRQALRRFKGHILALLDYVASEHVQ
jgi:hypothetical protein